MANNPFSKYYKLGDFVYAKDYRTNAWFAGQIVRMSKDPAADSDTEVVGDDGILYGIKFLESDDMLFFRANDIFDNCTKCYIDQLNIGDMILLPHCSLYPPTGVNYLYEGRVVQLNRLKSPRYVKLLLLNDLLNNVKLVCVAETTFIRMNTFVRLTIDSKSKDERCTLENIKEETVIDENYICESCSQKIVRFGDRLVCVRCKQMFHQYCLNAHVTQKTMEINWVCTNCEEKEVSVPDIIFIDVTDECIQAAAGNEDVTTKPFPIMKQKKKHKVKKKILSRDVFKGYTIPLLKENEYVTTKSFPIMEQKIKHEVKKNICSRDIFKDYTVPLLKENEHVIAKSSSLKEHPKMDKILIRRYYITSPEEENEHVTMESSSLKKRSTINKIHIRCVPRYHIVSPAKENEPPENKRKKMPRMMKRTCTSNLPKDYIGPIPGVKVGTTWKYRFQVSEVGIHLPLIAGIHGSWKKIACSIVFSGVYEGDKDFGDSFLYSGCGGKIEKGKEKLYCNQVLEKSNRSLALNCNAPLNSVVGSEAVDWKGGIPVRVVRSSKLGSQYAPNEGYRYDGIYKVVRYFPQIESHGYRVWRYELKRDDPEPPPWN